MKEWVDYVPPTNEEWGSAAASVRDPDAAYEPWTAPRDNGSEAFTLMLPATPDTATKRTTCASQNFEGLGSTTGDYYKCIHAASELGLAPNFLTSNYNTVEMYSPPAIVRLTAAAIKAHRPPGCYFESSADSPGMWFNGDIGCCEDVSYYDVLPVLADFAIGSGSDPTFWETLGDGPPYAHNATAVHETLPPTYFALTSLVCEIPGGYTEDNFVPPFGDAVALAHSNPTCVLDFHNNTDGGNGPGSFTEMRTHSYAVESLVESTMSAENDTYSILLLTAGFSAYEQSSDSFIFDDDVSVLPDIADIVQDSCGLVTAVTHHALHAASPSFAFAGSPVYSCLTVANSC